jgi:HEPN domain-containing protein
MGEEIIIGHCAKINPAYTTTRYPDAALEFNEDEVRDIISSAREVLKWIKKELKL